MRIAVPPGPALPVLASLLLGIVWQSIVRTPEPESDALLYDWLASALSGHGEPGQDVRYAVDGMAIRGWTQASLMAATYVVAGPEPAAYAWMQAVVLLPATTLLVYVAGRFAFGRAVGLVAAWGFALWFPLVYHTTWVMPETTIGLVAAGSLALLAVAVARASVPAALGLGVVLGVLSLTHSAWQFAGLLTLVALAVHLLVFDRSNLRLAAYAGVGLIAILGPYTVVQAAADLPQMGQGGLGYGAGGGWTLWSGSRSTTDFLPIEDSFTVANLNGPGGVVEMSRLLDAGELEIDEHLAETIRAKAASPEAATLQLTDGDFYDAALANLLDDPGAWPRKLEQGLTTVFLPNVDLVFFAAPLEQTWFREPWRPLAKGVVVLLVLGLALLVVRRRDRLIMAVPVAAQTAVFLVAVPEHRYGYPLLSSVFLLASYAVVSLVCVVRRARAGSTASETS